MEKLLRKAVRDYGRVGQALHALALQQQALEARWLNTTQRGGKVTKVKLLDSGRCLLTVEKVDGTREQFIVE